MQMVNDYVVPELKPVYPDTEKLNFEKDILYKNVTIQEYTSLVGAKGEFFVVKGLDSQGKAISFATSSAVLMKQIKDAKDKGELIGGLRAGFDRPKGKRYYTLVKPF